MVTYVGQGDPEKFMRLLWGRPAVESDRPRRGPKAALTVDQIVDTAIRLADAGGVDAVSMRSLAAELGKTPMALYPYVGGKAELLDLLWDRVLAELPTSHDLSDGWRPAAEAWATERWHHARRHPWLVELSGARPTLGPHETQVQETGAALFIDTGLTPEQVMRAVEAIGTFVIGSARTFIESHTAADVTGQDETEWWLRRSKLLTDLSPDYETRYPTLSRISRSGTFDLDVPDGEYLSESARLSFEFGLARLLDGIEALLASQ